MQNTLGTRQPLTPGLIMQKARGHHADESAKLPLFVGKWFQIFSLPSRGAFHLSLALLSSLSVSEEYLALAHGRARFTPVFPWQAVLGTILKGTGNLSHTGLSPSMAGLSRPFY